jgi:uncharacterized membrane protein YkvA (DUF1232 family)
MKNLVEPFYAWYRNTLRNSRYRWLIVVGTLIYLISPLDISPDFLPIVGWIDDGVLITLLVAEVSQMMAEFLAQRKQRSDPAATSAPAEDEVIDVQAH